jgi:hypothetical protein
MTRKVLGGSNLWKILLGAVCWLVALCLQPVALAQHGGFGGGHLGGGGHSGGSGMHANTAGAPHAGSRGSSNWHWPWHPTPHNATTGTRSSMLGTTPATLNPRSFLARPAPIAHPVPVPQPIFYVPVYFGSPFFYTGFNSFGCGCGAFWGAGCFYSPAFGLAYGFGSYGFGGYYGGYSGAGAGTGAYSSSNANGAGTMPAPSYESPEPPAHRNDLVELFFKDGTVADVTDYWVVEGQLHFVTVDESGQKTVEHVVPFDTLDVQTTNDDSTSRGFKFQLRNESLEQYFREHPEVVPRGVEPDGPGNSNQ